ncbi:MAG: ABC transporter ATP-binding protein, partial [Anaerolineales bacterium]
AYARGNDKSIPADLDAIYDQFPRLNERRTQIAGSLSGGEQQMLAIGRALMAKPRLLMLDEPSMGLAPILVNEVFQIIRRIQQQGMTILLVEQNARKALGVADYAYILERGTIRLHGPAAELQHDTEVVAAYLG